MKLHFPFRVILPLAAFLMLLCGCQKEAGELPEDLSLSDIYLQETEEKDPPPEMPEEAAPPDAGETPETDEPAEPEPIWQIKLLDGTVDLYSEELALGRGVQTVNRYVYSAGDMVEMGRVSADGGQVTVWTQQVGSGIMKCYDPETDTVRWTDSNMKGERRNGERYGYVQFDAVKEIDWFVDAFCRKGYGATIYRLRGDIVWAQ